ncbi:MULTISPECIES: SF1B family DNA helicase RecD2 [Shouchella]|uniref:SF1B family DNA helicase RecD2 n=1 Tax=Shouchella TaxID=2893057 RepID=UPI0009149B0B|nr:MULTISPECIES: ATP-dependent RecD-like DNA helicase [Shouchella]MBX0318274.1 ATP-dependent RecD-like DNA helicase [Shouchella clausii]SHK98230.1 ATP-dependent DNA helicase, RecD/TraA family [Shouchella rhizosphaerae]
MDNVGEKTLEKGFVKGKVVHVLFRNEENDYTVAMTRIEKTNEQMEGRKITVVGHLPELEVEETYLFFGQVAEHPRFGLQYKVETFRRDLPQTKSGIIRFLSSDRFPGVGKKTAEAIVDALGERAISAIIEDRTVLNNIPKLKEDTATMLYNQLLEQQGAEQVIIQLSQYGFGTELSMSVYRTYKLQALDVIRTNPYLLIQDVEGVGFRRADQLGAAIGLTGNHPERLRAGLLYLLRECCMQQGHLYLQEEALITEGTALLSSPNVQIDASELEAILIEMNEEGMLVREEDRIYMKSLYYAEKGIATNIRRILSQELTQEFTEADIEKTLGHIEDTHAVTYSNTQKEAIATALRSPLLLLTGGPGTGKTTVIKGIVEAYAALHGLSLEVAAYKNKSFPLKLTAPTGRASKRMAEATELPASTIHSLLGWKGSATGFEKGDHEQLEGELLIVDEMSMVDAWVANQLFKAIPKGMQVVLVGDENQLPSVGPGQVLKDLLEADVIPTIQLKDIYRQAEGSSIIELAHSMKDGVLPSDFLTKKADRVFFPCQPNQVQQAVWQICENAMKKGYSAKEIQVLAPMYRGQAGINELNTMLQSLFNPAKEGRRELPFGDVVFRKGDMVLQLVNNPEEGVYNGDRGEIVAVFYAKETTEKKDQLVVSFDGLEVTYEKKDFSQLTHAYCCSIHKAQGSEFPIVVMPVVSSYMRMLRRNLLYTGITRAKQYLLLCGDRKTMEQAIKHADEHRHSKLKERLQQLLSRTGNVHRG